MAVRPPWRPADITDAVRRRNTRRPLPDVQFSGFDMGERDLMYVLWQGNQLVCWPMRNIKERMQ